LVKQGIHPKYGESVVTCACGNSWTTRSTRPQLRTDVCSHCHPFYTGEQRIVDTAGRVERFMTRLQRGTERQAAQQQPPRPAPPPARGPRGKQPPPAARPPQGRPATLETLLADTAEE
jgi:large subunit ribosomal protein L31